MEFKPTYEKDAGPIIRWVATFILNIFHKIESPLYKYATMYEVIFDDEDEEKDDYFDNGGTVAF